ncbi:hypothetical protein Tcan_00372 [Toxocara canis]|uniref:Uncharacterized protein n=1 Tax=Toxocara canis TaxID=6265 RepID=A0A0B2VLV1_TOXCA|nr:hypothetical protein Tcan_00372 [Toxocara canis]
MMNLIKEIHFFSPAVPRAAYFHAHFAFMRGAPHVSLVLWRQLLLRYVLMRQTSKYLNDVRNFSDDRLNQMQLSRSSITKEYSQRRTPLACYTQDCRKGATKGKSLIHSHL